MKTIITAVTGSQMYGLATPDSDVDKISVHMESTRGLFGLNGRDLMDRTINVSDPEGDHVSHELYKFVKLASAANPTIMEVLWAEEYIGLTYHGKMLVDARDLFMSKRLFNAYGGYAKAQAERRMRRGDGTFSSSTKNRTEKNARHLCRLMLQGIDALTTGKISVRLTPEQIALCKEAETLSPEGLLALFTLYHDRLTKAYNESSLPDEPDTDRINALLIRLRYSNV